MIFALKIALIIAVSGVAVFVADYSRLTRGRVWKDPIGQTIIVKDLFLVGELMPLLLASFFHLSTLGNQIGVWILIGSIYLMGLAMYWRTWVFEREDRIKMRTKEVNKP